MCLEVNMSSGCTHTVIQRRRETKGVPENAYVRFGQLHLAQNRISAYGARLNQLGINWRPVSEARMQKIND